MYISAAIKQFFDVGIICTSSIPAVTASVSNDAVLGVCPEADGVDGCNQARLELRCKYLRNLESLNQ